MSRPVGAQEDIVSILLEIPAPPPPNPLMPAEQERPEEFFDKTKPPPDNAPIEDLLEYWAHQSSEYRDLAYNVFPSDRVLQRLRAEISRNPSEITRFVNVFRDSRDGAEFVKEIYERLPSAVRGETEGPLKTWLYWNSDRFAEELEGDASGAGPEGDYVRNHEELLALTRHAWERAEPIVNRNYNDLSSPTARVMAMWALYRRALDTDSIGDIDRYRAELIEVVEDRSATAAMRDLALDALTKEKEWSGRDEWYFSLLADETLADLRVGGRSFTGLTTIIYHMPDGHYTDKMIELAGSDNRTVRNAAVRNLLVMKSEERIVRALLPWLKDPEWADENEPGGRDRLVRALANFKIPESVPGLIAMLDERETVGFASLLAARRAAVEAAMSAANTAAAAANGAATPANAANYAGTNTNSVSGKEEVNYPYRSSAIQALAKQADARAVPALRRMLAVTEDYQRIGVVNALLASGGFSTEEKVNALVLSARMVGTMQATLQREFGAIGAISAKNIGDPRVREIARQAMEEAFGEEFVNSRMTDEGMLGSAVAEDKNPDEELVHAVMDRIERLERSEPATALGLRTFAANWTGPAVDTMRLRELRRGKSDVNTIVLMLADRKRLRETQMNNVLDVAGGPRWAAAVGACILEDRMLMEQMLEAGREGAAAVLACARLIRAPLDIGKATAVMNGTDPRASKAAEYYLESEDSSEARAVLLARYPGQAKVLGATTHFGERLALAEGLPALFASVSGGRTFTDYRATYGMLMGHEFKAADKRLQDEVLKDDALLGLYAYQNYKVRIYANRVMFAVEEDDKRFRERPMTAEEFKYLRDHLAKSEAQDLKPFLSGCESCEARQLVMLGKAGGRRVFMRSERTPEFFAVLDEYFEALKEEPGRLRYSAEKEIAGLEVEIADENLAAEAVWKEGGDLRVLFKDRAARKKVEEELEAFQERIYSEEEEGPEATWEQLAALRRSKMYDGYAWWSVPDEGAPRVTTAPEGIEMPPVRDGLAVEREVGAWMLTAQGIELRTDDDGLYAVRNGQVKRLAEGYFGDVRLSKDGRWAAGRRYFEDEQKLVRVETATGRVVPVEDGETALRVMGYSQELDRFVLMAQDGDGYEGHHSEYEPEFPTARDHAGSRFMLLHPATGELREAPGEVRPIVQQTYRPLQATGKTGEYWAALPDSEKDETVVGVYDARFMNFKPVTRVPKMMFDSMNMWVDAAGGRIYFLYKGHVLSVPMGTDN